MCSMLVKSCETYVPRQSERVEGSVRGDTSFSRTAGRVCSNVPTNTQIRLQPDETGTFILFVRKSH